MISGAPSARRQPGACRGFGSRLGGAPRPLRPRTYDVRGLAPQSACTGSFPVPRDAHRTQRRTHDRAFPPSRSPPTCHPQTRRPITRRAGSRGRSASSYCTLVSSRGGLTLTPPGQPGSGPGWSLRCSPSGSWSPAGVPRAARHSGSLPPGRAQRAGYLGHALLILWTPGEKRGVLATRRGSDRARAILWTRAGRIVTPRRRWIAASQ